MPPPSEITSRHRLRDQPWNLFRRQIRTAPRRPNRRAPADPGLFPRAGRSRPLSRVPESPPKRHSRCRFLPDAPLRGIPGVTADRVVFRPGSMVAADPG
jgi:hypothetical protein